LSLFGLEQSDLLRNDEMRFKLLEGALRNTQELYECPCVLSPVAFGDIGSTETDARRIWLVMPYISSLGKLDVAR
jgi:hypothetical protein